MTLAKLIAASGIALAGTSFALLPVQAFAAHATAAKSVTSACSTKYQAAKTAGTLGGQKWPQFLSTCSAAMNASTAGTTAPAAAAPAATAAAPAAKLPKTQVAAKSGVQTTQQICSGQYQAAKTAGTLGSEKWPQFLSACKTSIKNDGSDAAAAPAEPTATAPITASAPVATKSTDGKPLSAGQIAFRQRIHECSTEWQREKSTKTLPAGSKWPQFWSACNTRLKTQG